MDNDPNLNGNLATELPSRKFSPVWVGIMVVTIIVATGAGFYYMKKNNTGIDTNTKPVAQDSATVSPTPTQSPAESNSTVSNANTSNDQLEKDLNSIDTSSLDAATSNADSSIKDTQTDLNY